MTALKQLGRTHRAAEIELARATLTEFMSERATQTADEVGFKWVAVLDAPNDYASLKAAYAVSQELGAPLPISSEFNQNVIYNSEASNVAFRFVHDVHHVKFGLSFEVLDELELAWWHLGELEVEGFGRGSLPWRMLHADLIGQAHLIALAKGFPTHQWRFITGCLDEGFEPGLVNEARLIRARGAQS